MAANNDIKSLYFHIPFCRHLCNYCDFYKVKYDETRIDFAQFHSYLENAWLQHKDLLNDSQFKINELETLYFGGGTPSLWGEQGAKFFNQFMKDKFSLNNNYEFTMEADPGAWNEKSMKLWMENGVNRFSLGVQSYSDDFLKVMDRIHSKSEVNQTLEFFSKNLSNYSVDFLIGIPKSIEMKRDVITELKEILEYNPKHFSLYIISTRKNYPLNKCLPTDTFIADEYLKVSEFLKEQGYNHYEVSNFAKPGYESKHNLAYWNYASVAGIGPSATGLITNEVMTKRYKWKVSSPNFQLEELNESEILLEKVYLALRTNIGMSLNSLLDENQNGEMLKLAMNWKQRGLAEIESGKVVLKSNGFLVLDSLMDEIFNKIKM